METTTDIWVNLQGLTTIRSSGAQGILVQQFDGLQDIHSSSYFVFISVARGFQVWTEMVSITFQAIVTFGLLLFPGCNTNYFLLNSLYYFFTKPNAIIINIY